MKKLVYGTLLSFAGVRFFDIMIREALFKGVEWHMWLYYMPPVVERICRNYELCDPMVDESKEFPIKYSFLLYQIFANMRDWVLALEHVPENQPNVVLRSSTSQNENNNIPKSSLIALCDSAYFVSTSQRVGGRLQRTLINMMFELYFDIRSWSKHTGYAEAFLSILRDCGRYREHHEHYRHALLVIFSHEKHEYEVMHPHEHVEELEAALNHSL